MEKMIQLKKLAIAGAVSAAIFGAASAEAHVMYNTAIATNQVSGTDGWVWNGQGNPGYASGTYTPWLGTSGGALPFGYAGATHLNWAAAIHDYDALTVSEAAAAAHYDGLQVEIDTGAGAWLDDTGKGWKHQTDLGLIKSDFDTLVRINIARVSTPSSPGLLNDNFGVTIYTGMSTATSYGHHGAWNNSAAAFTSNGPWGSGVTYLTHDGTVNATDYIEFFATAGQVYTVALGGAGVGGWSANVSDYALTVKAVPVPGAVWLFGSAMAGMLGFARRKAAVAA
jgi:hypothetical protein